MRKTVIKTTFKEEQEAKQDAFFRLTPHERLSYMLKLREKMKNPNINYSYEGMTVKVKRGR